jgi:hypothetical protein
MKKLSLAMAMVVILFSSCYTLTHTVGSGGSGGEKIEKRAWYVLWGLVPLNTVESKAMAGNATNYTVTSSAYCAGCIDQHLHRHRYRRFTNCYCSRVTNGQYLTKRGQMSAPFLIYRFSNAI